MEAAGGIHTSLRTREAKISLVQVSSAAAMGSRKLVGCLCGMQWARADLGPH